MSGRIIGISGKAGSGKDTVAAYLRNEYGYANMAFADPMKVFCQEIFDWSFDQLWGPSEEREKIDPKWGFSPRKALQLLGTEWGRALDEDMWVKIGLGRALEKIKDGYPGVVITDCRFGNELRLVRASGGSLIRLHRNGDTRGASGVPGHASEMEQDNIPDSDFDWVVENNSSKEQLFNQIEKFMDSILVSK